MLRCLPLLVLALWYLLGGLIWLLAGAGAIAGGLFSPLTANESLPDALLTGQRLGIAAIGLLWTATALFSLRLAFCRRPAAERWRLLALLLVLSEGLGIYLLGLGARNVPGLLVALVLLLSVMLRPDTHSTAD